MDAFGFGFVAWRSLGSLTVVPMGPMVVPFWDSLLGFQIWEFPKMEGT